MSKSKEHLRELVEEAIYKSDATVVNFQALRDLLAASIGQHTVGGVIPQDSNNPPNNYGNDTKVNGRPASGRENSKNALPETAANVRQSIIKNNNMKDLTLKLDSILNRFNIFSQNLSQKMDKLNDRVKDLEIINLDKKKV